MSAATSIFLYRLGDYVGPINVWSSVSGAGCVRLNDGRLHVIRPGTFPDLLSGPDYLLVSSALAEALRAAVGPSLELRPTHIINFRSGKKLAAYHEVLPADEVTPKNIRSVDASGRRAWHYRKQHLFVTKEVAIEVQRFQFPGLEYSRGFSAFAGSEPDRDLRDLTA